MILYRRSVIGTIHIAKLFETRTFTYWVHFSLRRLYDFWCVEPCRVATVSSCSRVQFATVSSSNRGTIAMMYSRFAFSRFCTIGSVQGSLMSNRYAAQFCSCWVDPAHSSTRIESTRRSVHFVSSQSVCDLRAQSTPYRVVWCAVGPHYRHIVLCRWSPPTFPARQIVRECLYEFAVPNIMSKVLSSVKLKWVADMTNFFWRVWVCSTSRTRVM